MLVLRCLVGLGLSLVLASSSRGSDERAVATTASSDLTSPASEGRVTALDVHLQWHYSVMGERIGASGLHIADLAGTGEKSIVAAATMDWYAAFWWVASSLPGGGYALTWVSPPYASGIQALRVANVDGDPALEVLVGSGNGLFIYDGQSLELQAQFTTVATELQGLTVADVDADGSLELVFCDTNAVYVYGLTGSLEYRGVGWGGVDLAVGNVDLDPQPEIVVGNGISTGWVIDGVSHTLEWANSWGFGNFVRLGDVDGDGRSEAVAGYSWPDQIRIFDIEWQSLASTLSVNNDLGVLGVQDVEGDGPVEIVYGDWAGIWVLDGASHAVKWSVPFAGRLVGFALGDPDGDNDIELVWGVADASGGQHQLSIYNPRTQQFEWGSFDIRGPFRALSWGDVDADGRAEFLHATWSSYNGSASGLWFVHDVLTQVKEYQGPPVGSYGPPITRVRNANVDSDPQQEIFVATGRGNNDLLVAYDGLGHFEQWRAVLPDGLALLSLHLADVDLDGQLEAVASTTSPYSSGALLYVFDAATGFLEWQSPSLLSGANMDFLRIANVDGDPQPEILAGAYRGSLILADVVLETINNLGDHDVSALETPDRNGDGRAEILVGTGDGKILVLDTLGGIVETVANVGGRIDGLAVARLDGDGVFDYAYGVGGEVFCRSGSDGSALWRSGLIGRGNAYAASDAVGGLDSLYVADVDADGLQELVVNLGWSGFKIYEIGTDLIFADGFQGP